MQKLFLLTFSIGMLCCSAVNASDAALPQSHGSPIDSLIWFYGDSVSVDTALLRAGELSPPQITQRVAVRYPSEMQNRGVEGVVKTKVLIGTDGRAKRIVALNDLGYGSLDAAAEAIRSMVFSPASVDGKKTAVWIVVPVKFGPAK